MKTPTKEDEGLAHITTKARGETYEEAEERNNYFKSLGKKEALEDELKFLEDFIYRECHPLGCNCMICERITEIKQKLDELK